jgi:hypothetical protein
MIVLSNNGENKMKKMLMVMSSILIVIFVGCSGVMHSTKDLPDWYLNTPEEESALYGVGESQGDDLGLTRQDAQAAARDEIAQQIEIKISNLIMRSKQAIAGKTDANVVRTTSKQIANQSAKNIKIVKKEVKTKGSTYFVYALAKMPIESLKEQARRTLAQQDVQRQLDINADLQKILNDEIDKLDGTRKE